MRAVLLLDAVRPCAVSLTISPANIHSHIDEVAARRSRFWSQSNMLRRTLLPIPFAAMLALAACGNNNVSSSAASSTAAAVSAQDAATTATPIKHLVVIFGENESFDHYYGTYPNAQNPDGEPVFTAASGTPTVNGLTTALLTDNPTVSNTANGTSAINPFRLDRTQAST